MKKILSLILVALMIFASSICFVACNDEETSSSIESSSSQLEKEKMLYTTDTTLGEGATQFTLIVEHIDGKKINFTIKTDKTILADALTEIGIIEGKVESYGLYVKKVNGIIQDYDIDKTYWALYEGEDYASKGISFIEITSGATYKLVATK